MSYNYQPASTEDVSFPELASRRKSIRSFKPDPVAPEMIRRILSVATCAPTNCNQQLWNFIVITKNETKEQLIKEAASNTLFRRAPVLVAVTYDGWNYKEAIQGASLAVGHILLAAESFGLGALPMNSYGGDNKIKRILNIPEREVICCFVALGYSDDRANLTPPVPRRPVEEALHWETFQEKRIPPFTYDPNSWTLEDLQNHQKYYSRKTFLGKEMDIMSSYERALVKEVFHKACGPIVDICTYDGAYLREFPNVPLHTVDLTEETLVYTKAALELTANGRQDLVTHSVYDLHAPTLISERAQTVSVNYKLERLPDFLRQIFFSQSYATLEPGGELIIIGRKTNFFLSLFFITLRLIFGNDVRKTGIYTFFGPYRPLRIHKTIQALRKAGFGKVSWEGYYPIPPFYEQAYQMALQYIKSEGSSYLHRETRTNFMTRFLNWICCLQSKRRVGRFGSVAVIRCCKSRQPTRLNI